MSPVLLINGVDVPAHADSGSLDIADRASVARRWSGDLTYTRRGTTAGIVGHVRELEVTVRSGREWTRDQVIALHEELRDRVFHSVSGDLWGAGSEAEARDIVRLDGPREAITTLSFTLHERGPDETEAES